MCFEIWKALAHFLAKRSIIPRAKFEIWFSHLKSVYVGQTFFLEKRSITPQAILCVCHGFVASFCSANHFQANATVAGPYPNDIASQIVFCQTRRQHLLSRSKALSNISKQGILFQSEGILSDFVLRVIPDVYCQLRKNYPIVVCFEIWKVFYVDQTAFLENGNTTPRTFLVRVLKFEKCLLRSNAFPWKNESSSPERFFVLATVL